MRSRAWWSLVELFASAEFPVDVDYPNPVERHRPQVEASGNG